MIVLCNDSTCDFNEDGYCDSDKIHIDGMCLTYRRTLEDEFSSWLVQGDRITCTACGFSMQTTASALPNTCPACRRMISV